MLQKLPGLAGAVGYLLKRSTPTQIVDAIREVHAGGSPLTPEIARRVAVHFRQRPAPAPNAPEHVLTPREREILRLVAQGKSSKEVARALDVAVSTVSNHLRSIYAKLHVTCARRRHRQTPSTVMADSRVSHLAIDNPGNLKSSALIAGGYSQAPRQPCLRLDAVARVA